MKAGVYYGAKDIRPEEIVMPQITDDDVLVKVKSAGICGSDLHAYREGKFSRPGWVMGHELAGEVVEVGKNVKGIKKGARVIPMGGGGHGPKSCGTCFWCLRGMPQYCEQMKGGRKPCGKCKNCLEGKWWLCDEMVRYMGVGYGKYGGYAEYIPVWNARLNENIFPLPDNMSYDDGASVEPLRGVYPWIALAKPQPYDTAVVLGLGTIGLMTLQVLKQMVSKVIVSEVSQKRLQIARELGADVVIDATKEDPIQKVMEITGTGRSGSGKGGGRADFVMECSGSGICLQQSLDMTRAGGRIVLVGLFEKQVTIDPNKIIFKDLKLISSQGPETRSTPDIIIRGINDISSGKLKVKPLISHEFSVDKIKEAFDMQCNSAESVKVMVKPEKKD
jgi:threonine dehydrogenase-like Zn-dependent dehydrogenase